MLTLLADAKTTAPIRISQCGSVGTYSLSVHIKFTNTFIEDNFWL